MSQPGARPSTYPRYEMKTTVSALLRIQIRERDQMCAPMPRSPLTDCGQVIHLDSDPKGCDMCSMSRWKNGLPLRPTIAMLCRASCYNRPAVAESYKLCKSMWISENRTMKRSHGKRCRLRLCAFCDCSVSRAAHAVMPGMHLWYDSSLHSISSAARSAQATYARQSSGLDGRGLPPVACNQASVT